MEYKDLTEEKARLIKLIEEGEKEYLPKLEQIQKELEINKQSREFLAEQFGGIIPNLPDPPPGNPCVDPERTYCPIPPGRRTFDLLSKEGLFIQLSAEGKTYAKIDRPSGEVDGFQTYNIEMESKLVEMQVTKDFKPTGGKTTYSVYFQLF